MSIRETRPFPVPAEVVMRSTLFTLANMQATLQVYNEQTGVIVATVSKWLGLQKQEVVVKVRRFEQAAVLEVEAPDVDKARELLTQVSRYITDGAGRVSADATIQWVDIAKQQANKARRQQLVNRARSLFGGETAGGETTGGKTADETALTVVDDQGNAVVAMAGNETAAMVPVPDNPGVLVKNYQDQVIELKVDPQVFTDRTTYLTVCQSCAATVLRGSKYCPSCGRPLTLEAVQPELQGSARQAAQRSLRSGLIAFAAALIPFLLLILPELLAGDASLSLLENLAQALTPIRLLLSAVLGLLPAVGFGWHAISQARQADWYLNLNALFSNEGRTQAGVGRVLGWVAIYVSIGWVLLTGVALLFR